MIKQETGDDVTAVDDDDVIVLLPDVTEIFSNRLGGRLQNIKVIRYK